LKLRPYQIIIQVSVSPFREWDLDHRSYPPWSTPVSIITSPFRIDT
jgi:hypothetical protein